MRLQNVPQPDPAHAPVIDPPSPLPDPNPAPIGDPPLRPDNPDQPVDVPPAEPPPQATLV